MKEDLDITMNLVTRPYKLIVTYQNFHIVYFIENAGISKYHALTLLIFLIYRFQYSNFQYHYQNSVFHIITVYQFSVYRSDILLEFGAPCTAEDLYKNK